MYNSATNNTALVGSLCAAPMESQATRSLLRGAQIPNPARHSLDLQRYGFAPIVKSILNLLTGWKNSKKSVTGDKTGGQGYKVPIVGIL